MNGQAHGNVLVNINGSNLGSVIHVSANATGGVCPGSYNACDLTILGVTGSAGGKTIVDGLPGGTSLTDANIGMYVIGESWANGISRFSTSPNMPTWLVGTQQPGSPCVTGALYSCIATGANVCQHLPTPPTLWGCEGGQWVVIK